MEKGSSLYYNILEKSLAEVQEPIRFAPLGADGGLVADIRNCTFLVLPLPLWTPCRPD